MTSIRTIVTDALREAGIVPLGEDVSADLFEEGLRTLNRMFRSLFGAELGEPLKDINYGLQGLTNAYAEELDLSSQVDSVYVPSNCRVILNIGSPETLFLNPNPRDGCRFGVIDSYGNVGTYNVTLNANGRLIEGSHNVVLNTNGIAREWFYRSDTGTWNKVSDFSDGDNSPLPEEFDDLLTTYLAMRMNPRFGATSSSEMLETLKRIRRIFRARYRQIQDVSSETALFHLPSTRHYWQMGNNVKVFNHGKYWWYI